MPPVLPSAHIPLVWMKAFDGNTYTMSNIYICIDITLTSHHSYISRPPIRCTQRIYNVGYTCTTSIHTYNNFSTLASFRLFLNSKVVIFQAAITSNIDLLFARYFFAYCWGPTPSHRPFHSQAGRHLACSHSRTVDRQKSRFFFPTSKMNIGNMDTQHSFKQKKVTWHYRLSPFGEFLRHINFVLPIPFPPVNGGPRTSRSWATVDTV